MVRPRLLGLALLLLLLLQKQVLPHASLLRRRQQVDAAEELPLLLRRDNRLQLALLCRRPGAQSCAKHADSLESMPKMALQMHFWL